MISLPLLYPRRARAQVDPFEFEVYPYATESRGMIELETDNAVVANGHDQAGTGTNHAGTFPSQGLWYSGEEITYGLTDRIEAAAYVNFAQPSGHGFWWAGDKFRLRGRLFDEERLPVDLGWYTELEWHKTPQFDDADLELELKPIIEKDFGRLSLILNPLFEKTLYGTVYGGCNPRSDIPRLASLYKAGKLQLDELITRTYSLDQVNEGYADMLAGKNIRGVIVNEH